MFVFYGRLPGMNEYTAACRGNAYKANKMKQEQQFLIRSAIRKAIKARSCHPVKRPVIVRITWQERTSRRDIDNIQAAQKFVLDAMKGILIEDDSQKYVRQIYHEVRHGDEDAVYVELQEV